MAYSRTVRSIVLTLCLVACGASASAAWQRELWGTLTGAILTAFWLGSLNWWMVTRHRPIPEQVDRPVADRITNRLLLDAAPTPMLAIEDNRARAINRAARQLFATDDRVIPLPAELVDHGVSHIHHEGRAWRVNRVNLIGSGEKRMVVALIDVEEEERAAEARAVTEMIHVLGHELLNGLAPIASLAESGEAVLDGPDIDLRLLREIFGTLSRRVDGLQRFTEAYRALARLPEPLLRPVAIEGLVDDLSRLFIGRWPSVQLAVDVDVGVTWSLDRDQIVQAVWALLQNAAEAAGAAHERDAKVMLIVRYSEARLAIDVQDNGSGVPKESVGRIFRPFYTTKPEGTGIGLSLARQIADAHGGALTFELENPTTFSLSLPRNR